MGQSYEEKKQENLSEIGRNRLQQGGYYEVTLFFDWIQPVDYPNDNYVTIDFVVDDEMKEEYFPEVDFEKDDSSGDRDEQLAEILSRELTDMVEQGFVLDAYGNENIQNVEELNSMMGKFRIVA